MKKILALLLAITMIAAFCACAQKSADTAASDGALIKDLQNGKAPAEKAIIMDEKGFDASAITQEDVDNYGI